MNLIGVAPPLHCQLLRRFRMDVLRRAVQLNEVSSGGQRNSKRRCRTGPSTPVEVGRNVTARRHLAAQAFSPRAARYRPQHAGRRQTKVPNSSVSVRRRSKTMRNRRSWKGDEGCSSGSRVLCTLLVGLDELQPKILEDVVDQLAWPQRVVSRHHVKLSNRWHGIEFFHHRALRVVHPQGVVT